MGFAVVNEKEAGGGRLFRHPVWLVGFRPFFTLACVSGAALPLLWGAIFAGWLALPGAALPGPVWHAHEMFYGFGWAVLGGFLLTASKNWVGVRGMHGGMLAFAVGLWLVERVAVLWSAALPEPLRLLLLNGSVLFVGGYVVWTLVRHRAKDSFPDNYYFVIALPLLLVSKNLLLNLETFAAGVAMTVGLFRLAFVVMFERTIPQFMKVGLGTPIPLHRALDLPIKAFTLLAVFQHFLPRWMAVGALLAAGSLLLVRFFLWKPQVGLSRFDVGLMYVGYLGLVAHLFLEAARLTGQFVGLGAFSLHVFTFVTMGLVIPGMFVRISHGHTGRKIRFGGWDRLALWTMGAGAVFRLAATQLWPAQYVWWIGLSALAWSACFAIVAVRIVPFLWQPRLDGRLH